MTSDDVSVGQLVAVVRHRCGTLDCDVEFDGGPYKVRAVALPFAVMECCLTGVRTPIDLRVWELGKVSASYARALLGGAEVVTDSRADESPKSDHARCVRCGDRLVQRLDKDAMTWCWYCRQCNRVGELVK